VLKSRIQFRWFVLVIIAQIINAAGFKTLPKLPLSNDTIEPAVEALMREHGAKGFYGLAATWQQIRHKIAERQQREELPTVSK
jgi:hypothetical protein